jgi:hypothetical protein
MEAVGAIFILLLVAAFYFLPTILGMLRHKRNSLAIFALNLLLGWTLIGWIIALVWGLTADAPASQVVVNNVSPVIPSAAPIDQS